MSQEGHPKPPSPPPPTPTPPATPLHFIISTPHGDPNGATTQRPKPSAKSQSDSDPKTKMFLDDKMAKPVPAGVVPIATFHTTVTSQDTSPVLNSLNLSALCIGFNGQWLGMSYSKKYPSLAKAAVRIGAACTFLPIFTLIASLLPAYLAWIPGICFGAIILSFVESYFTS